MKYYTITPTRNIEDIGKYPQVIKSPNGNQRGENSYNKITPYKFMETNPDIDIEFNINAKRTNLIENTRGFGLFVDQDFLGILDNFNLPEHKNYPFKLELGNFIYQYYWLHYIIDTSSYLIRENSSIDILNKFSFNIIKKDVSMYNIENLYEYEKKLEQDQTIRIKHLEFRKELEEFDLFDISLFGRYNLISENLKNELLNNNMTGFDCKICDFINFK